MSAQSSGASTRSTIARAAIDTPLFTWLVMLGCLLGGLWGFSALGRLEDPAFTIKQAVVIATYPGASAAEVAEEVAEPLETAIQRMEEVDTITSTSQPGFTVIEVSIETTYNADQLPDIWTRLRERVGDAAAELPSGAGTPEVNDSFGDVFGIFFAMTADGYTDAERYEIVSFIRRELLAIDGVADVELAGLPQEAIFVLPNLPLSVSLSASPAAIINAIATADSITNAGVDSQNGARILLEPPGGYDSASQLSRLDIGVGQGAVVNLFDFAEVTRGRAPRQQLMIRHNGVEAITLGIAGLDSENIVEIGARVDARLAELRSEIPVGVELHPIYQQHVIVDEASSGFIVNLAMSVSIVVVVLALFMGWRAAVVVGSTLLLTVIGTLFFMALFSIEMERISLGALIIAMGMLVDNAIVVAEGMQIQMKQGRRSREAAADVGSKTQMPLLGATVIGILAFAGIGLSPDDTGEFLFSLFAVIGISLLLSWVLAITATPLLAHYLFKTGGGGEDAYGGGFYSFYRTVLTRALRLRLPVVGALAAITVLCFAGFGQVRQQFFPDSNTPLFYAHIKLPQGAEIESTSAAMEPIEAWLQEQEEVVAVSSFVGQGASRFMLTYAPENANPSYGHLIIRVADLEQLDPLRARLDAWGAENLPGLEFRTQRLAFGPGGSAPVEVRVSGADPEVLRVLADEAAARLAATNPELLSIRTNWREQEFALRPLYAPDRAQTAGVSRDDIASTLSFATDGLIAGEFREGDRVLPIIVRQDQSAPYIFPDLGVFSDTAGGFVPMSQVIDGFEVEIVDTLYQRRDRVPTITVAADIPAGTTAAEMRAPTVASIEEMTLPVGYRLEWGGEHESSADAQASLATQLPLSLLMMILITILLFGALRQTAVIWLLVPMSINGVVIALLGTGLPFTFTALLGLLSLSGMLIKNGIVLVEEIDILRGEGRSFDDAVVQASVSRLRPIVLAAATTILGMLPLLWDAFFASMAVTIMGGLAFATILTLIAAPVLYSLIVSRTKAAA